jgi:hypothetical protein
MNWSFIMERWCGSLLPAVKSRRLPYVTLALRQHQMAMLHDVVLRYELDDVLQLSKPEEDKLSKGERVFVDSNCKLLLNQPSLHPIFDFFFRQALHPSDSARRRPLPGHRSSHQTSQLLCDGVRQRWHRCCFLQDPHAILHAAVGQGSHCQWWRSYLREDRAKRLCARVIIRPSIVLCSVLGMHNS